MSCSALRVLRNLTTLPVRCKEVMASGGANALCEVMLDHARATRVFVITTAQNLCSACPEVDSAFVDNGAVEKLAQLLKLDADADAVLLPALDVAAMLMRHNAASLAAPDASACCAVLCSPNCSHSQGFLLRDCVPRTVADFLPLMTQFLGHSELAARIRCAPPPRVVDFGRCCCCCCCCCCCYCLWLLTSSASVQLRPHLQVDCIAWPATDACHVLPLQDP